MFDFEVNRTFLNVLHWRRARSRAIRSRVVALHGSGLVACKVRIVKNELGGSATQQELKGWGLQWNEQGNWGGGLNPSNHNSNPGCLCMKTAYAQGRQNTVGLESVWTTLLSSRLFYTTIIDSGGRTSGTT